LRFSDANPGSEQIKTMTRYALSYFNTTLPMQNKKLIYRSLLSLGKSLTRRKEFDLARDCFRRLIKEQTYLHEKVIFEYFWTYAVQGDYEAGLEKVIAKHVPNLDSIKSNSKLHFWIGLSHAKEGDDDKAKSIFKDLIKTNPLSYYAILSAKKLSKYTDSDTQEIYLSLLQENQKKQERNLANNSTDYHWLKRLIGWSIVNNDTLLNLEIKNAKSLKTGSDLQNHLLFAAYSLGNQKDYLESFKIIYQSVDNQVLNVNKTALKILFPQPFFNQIKTKTKNFDPVIALSLIRQESGFNTHAKSIVGARGLMQLMPNTAKRFKRRLKTRQLYNPRLNIQIGTTYFKKLLNRYDQNLVYALSAYNAGERRVDEWQEQYLTSDSILQNIENIPFLETRKYVKLIFRNIFFYKMLYNDEKTDSTDFNKIYDIHLGF
jgi:soluble lytic murein transglycosylase